MISHSQDFLNGVCTNIIHINKKRLKYYTGNYDAFVRTRMELLENQMKQYNWEQDQINHMKVRMIKFLFEYVEKSVSMKFNTQIEKNVSQLNKCVLQKMIPFRDRTKKMGKWEITL